MMNFISAGFSSSWKVTTKIIVSFNHVILIRENLFPILMSILITHVTQHFEYWKSGKVE